MKTKIEILIGLLFTKGAICRPRILGDRQISLTVGLPTSTFIETPTTSGSIALPSLSLSVPTISASVALPTGFSGSIVSTTGSLNWSLPTGIPPTIFTSIAISVEVPETTIGSSEITAPTLTLPPLTSSPTIPTPTLSFPIPTIPLPPIPTLHPTNPHPIACPLPSNFIVNDFTYSYGPPPLDPYGTSLSVKYGDLELHCPVRPGAWSSRYGYLSLECDDAGLVTAVVGVGGGGVHFNYNGFCGDVGVILPTNQTVYGTLGMQTPTLDITPFLECEYPYPQQPAIRNCSQGVDDFVLGPGHFFEGTVTGRSFKPVGVDGIWVQTCPIIEGVNPVLSDSVKCTHVGEEEEEEEEDIIYYH